MEAPRELDMNLVDSQQARRVLDRLVGYKISPIISKKIKSGLSAGRVQSVALEMLVKREREIKDFKPEEYWTINAMVAKEQTPAKKNIIKSTFVDIDGKEWKIKNAADAEKIVKNSETAAYVVDTAKRSEAKVHAQPPFTTSTMQQDASRKLSMSAPQTMQIAQQLYEGVEIEGEGATALVTYIRTDSVRVSPDMQTVASAYIEKRFGSAFVPKKPNIYKTKSGAQDAHEAIRPISLERTPESLQAKINRQQYRLYKLIYERFLASQMTDALYNTLSVHVTAESPDLNGHTLGYKINGRTQKFAGFTAVYSVATDEEDEATDSNLPNLNEGDKLYVQEVKSEQKFTKAPPRYTDATLIKAMEENGIGRPSTYASIISVLSRRDYTEKEGKTMKPTVLGETVCDYMMQHFPDIMDLKFTAKMEGALDKIEENGVEWQTVIESFYPKFIKSVISAVKNGGHVHLEYEESDVICEKCGAKLIIKEGKYGKFLACPNYPHCQNIKPFIEEVGKCPKCEKPVARKRAKNGKMFYACTGYPECNFMSWDLPAPYFCPKCGSTMKVTTSKHVKKYVCTNQKCTHSEVIKESE
jgi:DNA topoisomerase I, bacterial